MLITAGVIAAATAAKWLMAAKIMTTAGATIVAVDRIVKEKKRG